MTPPPPKGKNPAPGDGEASDEEVRRQAGSNAISDLLEARAGESRSQGPVDLSPFEAQFVTEPVRSPEVSTFDGLPEDSSSKNSIKAERGPSPVATRSGETVPDVKSDVEGLIDIRTVPPSEGHRAPPETKQNVSESDTSIKAEASSSKSPQNRDQTLPSGQSTALLSTTRGTAERENDPEEPGNSSNTDDEASKVTEDPSRKVQAMMVDKVMSSFMDWLDVRLKVKKEEPAVPPPAGALQPRLHHIGMSPRLPMSRPVPSGASAARTNALGTAFPRVGAPPASITSTSDRFSGALYGSPVFYQRQQRPAFQPLDNTFRPESSSARLGRWDQFDYIAAPMPALSAPPVPPPPAAPQLPPGNALPKRSKPSEEESKSPPQSQTSMPGLDDIDDGRSEHSDVDCSITADWPASPPTAKSGFLRSILKSRKEKKTRTLPGSPPVVESEAATPPMRARRKAAAVIQPLAVLETGTATTWPASSSSGTMSMGQQATDTDQTPLRKRGRPARPSTAKDRIHDREDEEEAGEDGDGNHPPSAKISRVQQDEISGAKLACPFFKHNPRKYKNQRPCCGPGWDHVHRIKEHIYRKHSLPKFSCPRCNQPFETQSELQGHARSPDPCEVREPEVQDGITQDQEKKLRSRKKTTAKELTETEKWTQVYKILFPDVREREIPSPHYTTEDAQTNLGGYEDYLRRELPPLVRRQLEKEVERELSYVEEGMKHKVIEIARNLQLALFRGYQTLEHQERGGNGADGPSPDDASTSEAGPSSSSYALATTDTSPSTMTTQGTTPEVPDPLDIFTNDPTIPDFDFDFLSEVPYPATEDLSKELDVAFGFPGAYDAQGPSVFHQPGMEMEAFGGPQVDMPFYGTEPCGDSQSKAIDTRLLSYAP